MAESTGKQGKGILPIADEPLADPGAYGPDRVFVHLRDADAPDPRHAEAMHALRRGRPPDDHADGGRRGRPRAAVLLRRVRHRGRRLGAGDQPVRPAQRPGGEGQHGEGARAGRAGGAAGRLARRAARRARVAGVPGDHGLPALRRRDRPRGRRRCGRTRSSATASRRRGATARASCTRPASSTRAARRTGRFLQLVHDSDADLDVPGQPYTFRTLIDAQADGDLQTLRDHGLPGRARAAARRRPAPAPSPDSRSSSSETRLRRPRQDGRQHGPSHPPRLGPPGRRVRLLRRTPSRPPRATARAAPRRSRTSSPSSTRRGSSG